MPKFLGEIKLNGGDFALLDAKNIRGGFMQVSTLKERDDIVPDKLVKGMHCYVEREETIFEWRGDKWVVFHTSGDDVSKVRFLTVSLRVKDLKYIRNKSLYGIKFDEDTLFHDGDIIGWGISINKDGNIVGDFTTIDSVEKGIAYIPANILDPVPQKYSVVYLVGSISDPVRSCAMVLHPYHGTTVLSQFLNTSLDSINTHYTFRLGQHDTNKWKVYGEDVYFRGTFIDELGRNLSELLDANQEAIDVGLAKLIRLFDCENLLNNPYFINGMDCWFTRDTATYFKVADKWVMSNKALLSAQKAGAYISTENNKTVLRLINGFIKLKNANLRLITDLDTKPKPYYVTVIFNYKVITPGTINISMAGETTDGYETGETTLSGEKVNYSTTSSDLDGKYHTFRASFLWNGTGDFTLSYRGGEVKILTLVIKVNEAKTLERQYKELFKYSDTLIEVAKKHLEQT